MGHESAIPWEAVEWPVIWKPGMVSHMFDWTINLGQVGIALTFVFSLGVWATAQKFALIQVKEQLKNDAAASVLMAAEMKHAISNTATDAASRLADFKLMVGGRLDKFDTRLEDYNKILIALARQEERISSNEDKIAVLQQQFNNLANEFGSLRMASSVPTRLIEAVKTMDRS